MYGPQVIPIALTGAIATLVWLIWGYFRWKTYGRTSRLWITPVLGLAAVAILLEVVYLRHLASALFALLMWVWLYLVYEYIPADAVERPRQHDVPQFHFAPSEEHREQVAV